MHKLPDESFVHFMALIYISLALFVEAEAESIPVGSLFIIRFVHQQSLKVASANFHCGNLFRAHFLTNPVCVSLLLFSNQKKQKKKRLLVDQQRYFNLCGNQLNELKLLNLNIRILISAL